MTTRMSDELKRELEMKSVSEKPDRSTVVREFLEGP